MFGLYFLPVHNRRWFKLIGNLLFYMKSEIPVGDLWFYGGPPKVLRSVIITISMCATVVW